MLISRPILAREEAKGAYRVCPLAISSFFYYHHYDYCLQYFITIRYDDSLRLSSSVRWGVRRAPSAMAATRSAVMSIKESNKTC